MNLAVYVSPADLGTVPLATARPYIHNMLGETGDADTITIERGEPTRVESDNGLAKDELQTLLKDSLEDLRNGWVP